MFSCRKKQAISSSQLSQMQLPVQNDSNDSQTTTTPDQPAPPTAAPIWGQLIYEDVRLFFDSAYEEIVFWCRNLFMLPSGAAGKKFVNEITRLLDIWNSNAMPMKEIALKGIMIMPALLLQKPSFKSKTKEHCQCLERRMVCG